MSTRPAGASEDAHVPGPSEHARPLGGRARSRPLRTRVATRWAPSAQARCRPARGAQLHSPGRAPVGELRVRGHRVPAALPTRDRVERPAVTRNRGRRTRFCPMPGTGGRRVAAPRRGTGRSRAAAPRRGTGDRGLPCRDAEPGEAHFPFPRAGSPGATCAAGAGSRGLRLSGSPREGGGGAPAANPP
jgi:hypothetical protein